MIAISSKIGCRNCLQSDGLEHIYQLVDGKSGIYQGKSEFEVMQLIEKWNSEHEKVCNLCGSSSLEVLDVKVDEYPLYEFRRVLKNQEARGLTLLMINIDKVNSETKLRVGGSEKIQEGLFYSSIDKILEIVDSRPEHDFIEHTRGNFFLCVSGVWDFNREKGMFIIERYRSHGLTRTEIISSIKNFTSAQKPI